MLAVRLHPLASARRHRHRDPELARRPLPLPDRLHRPPPGHRRYVVETFLAACDNIADLQCQLDRYRQIYKHQRPHRALDRTTPATAYTALPKATPTGPTTAGHHRLRHDHVDPGGKVSLRRAGRMHHLGVGYRNRGRQILAIADDSTVTVIDFTTGEILSTHTIDPDKTYWRNTQKAPGRWPGAL